MGSIGLGPWRSRDDLIVDGLLDECSNDMHPHPQRHLPQFSFTITTRGKNGAPSLASMPKRILTSNQTAPEAPE
eukprot:970106-Amphidinium_carterae.1